MHGSTTPPEREPIRRLEVIGNKLRQLITQARRVLAAERIRPERGRLFRDVMRLDVVAGGGHTPNSYGWHVDDLLNVGHHYANNPVVASEEPPVENGALPDRVLEPIVHRVPRMARSQPKLQLGGAQ